MGRKLWGRNESINLDALSANFNAREIEITKNTTLHIKIHNRKQSRICELKNVRPKRID